MSAFKSRKAKALEAEAAAKKAAEERAAAAAAAEAAAKKAAEEQAAKAAERAAAIARATQKEIEAGAKALAAARAAEAAEALKPRFITSDDIGTCSATKHAMLAGDLYTVDKAGVRTCKAHFALK